MRIGVFGGSFNPIHNGHIELIRGIISELALDRLLVVPSFLPPHKVADTSVSPENRLDMCRISISEIPDAEISDIEIRRGGTSYTYETLEELRSIFPRDELFLIMGADMFLSIDKWKNPEIIFSLATVCGVPREGIGGRKALLDREPFLNNLGAKTEVLSLSLPQISSTEVRQAVKYGQDLSKFVPTAVKEYILKNRLYIS